MPSTLLIALAAVVGLAVVLTAAFAVVARRPSLVRTLARFGPVRRLMDGSVAASTGIVNESPSTTIARASGVVAKSAARSV